MTWGIPNNVLYGMAMLLVMGFLCVLYAYYVAKRYANTEQTGAYKSNGMGTTHVTPVGGNIFLDLGFEPEEAEAMLLESSRRIAAKQQTTSSVKT